MGRRKIKDNDVYDWSFKDITGVHEPYWCKSRIAIAIDGRLYDNFWNDQRMPLDKKKITIKFKGNLDEMTEISRGNEIYYRYEDIVDMRHSNSYGAKIYIKPNVERDEKTIIELLAKRKDKYEFDRIHAGRRLEDLEKEMEKVISGNLDEVWVPCN